MINLSLLTRIFPSNLKHTTSHRIMQLLNKYTSDNNVKPKHLTAAILCDLSKAFDVINHTILIRKLEHYGIRGVAKTWMVNYLTNSKLIGNVPMGLCLNRD